MEASPPSVIVTGGSGLVGSRVVEHLAQRYRVFVWDVKEPKTDLPPGAEFAEVDLTSDDSVKRAAEDVARARGELAGVVHLAAYYDFSGEPSDLYETVTVRGSERLITALRDAGPRPGQFLFSSTMLVHRPTTPGRPIREDDPLEAKWPYPQSKVRTERLLERERGGIRLVRMRIAGVYTDQCDALPLAQQIARIDRRSIQSRVFPGDVTHGQAFVHLDDLARAIGLSIDRRDDLPPDLPLLIGEPETLSYDHLQREFARLIHGEPDWRTHQIPRPAAKLGAAVQGYIPAMADPFIKPWMIDLADDHYELDITEARRKLGWEPEHTLRDALPKMVEALEADPPAWYRRHKLELPARRQ
ncbi:MAG: NAD-dependent epimerase/dehydratase family protein [Phycisphaeraceae bacterium]